MVVIAEKSGTASYVDLIDSVSIQETTDDATDDTGPLDGFFPPMAILEGVAAFPRCLYCRLRFKFVAAS